MLEKQKTDSYSHVCNTWIKYRFINYDERLRSLSQARRLEKLQVADMCIGVDVKKSVYEISLGDSVNLQPCSNTFNQRVLIEAVEKSNCSSMKLLNVTSSGMCARFGTIQE